MLKGDLSSLLVFTVHEENTALCCPCCLMQPMLKSCPGSHLTLFPHEKDTPSHLSTDCRKVQVQKRELPFNTDHKAPFDSFFTGLGTGQGFGTPEGTRHKQRLFCTAMSVTDVSAATFCSRRMDVTSCEVCKWQLPCSPRGQHCWVKVTRHSLQCQQCHQTSHRFRSALTGSTCELQNHNLSASRNHSWIANQVIKQTTAAPSNLFSENAFLVLG